MFLARYKTEGKEQINLYMYHGYNDFIRETFSPDTEIITLLDFTIHGKTYQERKDSLQDIAIAYSHTDCSGLSWLDMHFITEYFSMNGRRYGLMQEFTENAIC